MTALPPEGTLTPLAESSFCASLTPGKHILPARDGWWNWGMAPIYDQDGTLHIFNSSIPKQGNWGVNSVIQHFRADSVEGPYALLDIPFCSDETTYHNPQISKVGDLYVLVYLMNDPAALPTRVQAIGLSTAQSLDGPWTASPHNPIIAPSNIPGHVRATHASNPTFLVDRQGRFRIYYKARNDCPPAHRTICLATADSLTGPYQDHESNPLISYESLDRDIEDPYAFFYQDTYYMIVEDRMDIHGAFAGTSAPGADIVCGGLRPGLLYTSQDGIDWSVPETGYQTNASYFGEALARCERPHILWNEGEPEYLFLSNHSSNEAGFYLKIGDWQPGQLR